MNQVLLKVYHRMPPQLRSIAATARGAYLRSWRYGPRTEGLVAAALEREHWSQERWNAWRDERLSRVLHRAATQVPYYREQWLSRLRKGERASWEYLENWPILEKEMLRENPQAFVADDCDIRRMFHEHTSGTTGKSLDLWWSRAIVQIWYALFEARCRHWYGVSSRERWAILGGQLVTPINHRKPPFWVWNQALNQLYMSTYHLAPDLVPYYLDALKSYRIKYLWGYSSALNTLAQEVLRLGRHDVNMKVVITNAEPVFDYQRQAIGKAFGCPVRETYGMAEIVTAASECEVGHLHLWPEVGITEVVEGNQSGPPGGVGELVCTGLLNKDMPLIRYRVGDRGRLMAEGTQCVCGRSLPMLQSIEGRNNDVLLTQDGRKIFWLNPVFYNLPVREAQIVQEALGRVTVRYVPAPNFTPEAKLSIRERLQDRMGPVEVLFEEVSEVPRSANGKFRAVVCSISPEERALALGVAS